MLRKLIGIYLLIFLGSLFPLCSEDFFDGLNPKPQTSEVTEGVRQTEFKPEPGQRFECIPSSDLLGNPYYLGNLKIINAYLSKTCSFHVYFTIDSKRFRRLMFNEEGAVDFFLSTPESTVARTFYPVTGNKPSLALRISSDKSVLEILHPSGEIVEISTRTGEIVGFSNVTMRTINWDRDPIDSNSPFIGYANGILLDSGVRWGVDPRIPIQGKGSAMKLRQSFLINGEGKRCKVPNYYLFKYEYDYRGDEDHVLMRFANSQEPQTLDFKRLGKIRDSLPKKFQSAFNRKIKLISKSQAPKDETFAQYSRRICPALFSE